MRLLINVLLCFFMQLTFAQNNNTADNHNDKAIDELMLGNNQTALHEINQALK